MATAALEITLCHWCGKKHFLVPSRPTKRLTTIFNFIYCRADSQSRNLFQLLWSDSLAWNFPYSVFGLLGRVVVREKKHQICGLFLLFRLLPFVNDLVVYQAYAHKGTSLALSGSKLNRRRYAGFGPCFHLPGFHFGTGCLSHSHICMHTCNVYRILSPHHICNMYRIHNLCHVGNRYLPPMLFFAAYLTLQPTLCLQPNIYVKPKKCPIYSPCVANKDTSI